MIIKLELDKSAHLCINNNLYFVDGAKLGEDMVNLLFSSVQAQTKHTQTPRWCGVFLQTTHG